MSKFNIGKLPYKTVDLGRCITFFAIKVAGQAAPTIRLKPHVSNLEL